MEELAREFSGRLTCAVVDVCESIEAPSDLGVMGIPTLVFFKEGHEVNRVFGAMKRERLIAAIRKYLSL